MTAGAKLHQLLARSIACVERGDYDGGDRLFYQLARKSGRGAWVADYDDLFRPRRRR